MAKDDKTPNPPAEPIQGGPGAEPEQQTPPQPKLVTIKHGGREL